VIALIDYHAGNLTSVKKAFAALGADLFVPAAAADLHRADAIVVPGVGHFAATGALTPEWVDRIQAHVEAGRPLLGICLGMQWLFEGSEEAPECAGLGLLAGSCYRLPAESNGTSVKIPHVGWNALDVGRCDSIVDGVATGAQVYFTHSFVAPVTGDTVVVTEQATFASVVRGDTSPACSFIREMGDAGLRILRNFLSLVG
jgi:glutamine amidotransferase